MRSPYFPFFTKQLLRCNPVLACALATTILYGCRQDDQIDHYIVTKPELVHDVAPAAPAVTKAEPQQMLVAMAVVDNAGWFFKLTGSPQRVAPQEAKFQEFLQTIEFSGPQKSPKWKVPAGWTTGNPGGIRFATLVLDTEIPPLELVVTRLEKSIASDEEYVLSNMNRWRQQLQLPDFDDEAAVRKATTELEVHGHKLLLANFAGTGSPPGGALPHPAFPGGDPPKPSSPQKPAVNLKFALPEGWQEVPASPPFSFAKFKIERDGTKLEVSISTAGGELLANVNRWRDQIGLAAIDEKQLLADVKPMDFSGTEGHFIELIGAGEAILGVIAPHQGQTWFVKLRGDAKLAAEEKSRFEQFVKSLQLP